MRSKNAVNAGLIYDMAVVVKMPAGPVRPSACWMGARERTPAAVVAMPVHIVISPK